MEIREANFVAPLQVLGEYLQKILFNRIRIAEISLDPIPSELKGFKTVFIIWGSARVVLRLRANRLLRLLGLEPPRWLMIGVARGSPNP